jgi:hypothetical protein
MPVLKRDSNPAYLLSWLIAALALIASAGGLLMDGLYRDNLFVTSALRGNDLVTLAVALPAFVAAILWARRGSMRAYLVWLGLLDYMLYGYAFYLFGAAFNVFFLIYVALLALSLYALIYALLRLDVDALTRHVKPRAPVRWVCGYLLVVAVGLSAVYLAQTLAFIVRGELPAIIPATGHPTNVVFALDLTLMVPALVLAAVWLWQRRPWGYVLATALAVKGAIYPLALAAGSLWGARVGVPGGGSEAPMWLTLSVAGLIASLFLLAHVRPASDETERP